jgi:hypothetical protein
MLKLALIGAAALPVAAAGAVALTGVAVVDVREGGGQGHRIVVPVPLALAQTAVALVPAEKTHLRLPPEAVRYLPIAKEVMEALAAGSDGELVRVEEPNQTVLIRKQGGLLLVNVANGREKVTVRVPLEVALAALPGPEGQLDASRALRALGQARFTKLVDVHASDGAEVKVTLY